MLLISSAPSLLADDSKSADNKVYPNIAVVDSKSNPVTMLHQDGGTSVPLANSPADIQDRSNPDPARVKPPTVAPVNVGASNDNPLRPKREHPPRTPRITAATQDTAAPQPDSAPAVDEIAAPAAAPTPPVSHNGAHYSMDDLTSSMQSLQSDASDTSHHSMDEIANSGM
jgi:hypothetical protein